MLLIASPRFGQHITPPGHPESPARTQVFDGVARRWSERATIREPRPATLEELARVHDPAYLEMLEKTAGRSVMLDPDTFTSPDSEPIARLAAGAAIEAAEHAVRAREPAFALVRPPGHHAEGDRAMGFCLYNNAAVAAASMRAAGLSRVAIVDIDVHHGNGTQHTFYDDRDVLYLSTHQFPFYPGTGAAEEVGSGIGKGFTVNVPIEAGATDGDYIRIHEAVVLPVLDAFEPELTIVSAGYDAHEKDPLASMRMSAAGYGHVFTELAAVALRHGALCAVTEGGYDLDALSSCLDASLEAMDGKLKPTLAGPAAGTARAERAIAAVRAAHKSFWRQL